MKNDGCNTRDLILRFVGISIYFLLSTFLLLSGLQSFNFISERYYTFYNQYQLYWVWDLLYAFITSYYVVVIVLLAISINKPMEYIAPNIIHAIISKNRKAIYKFVIFWIITWCICEFPLVYYHLYYDADAYFNEHRICSLILCGYWYPFWTFVNIINSGLLPLILYIIWIVICLCIQNNKNQNSQIDSIQLSDLDNALNQQLLTNDGGDSENKKVFSNKEYHTMSILFIMFYVVLWITFWIFYSIKDELIEQYWLHLYIGFFIWHSLFKFIFKRIGRKCDEMRQYNECNHYFSCEYFVQWTFSCIYENWIRMSIAFQTPQLTEFIIALCIHSLSQLFQANIRFSSMYFKISNKILNGTYSKCNIMCILQQFFTSQSDVVLWRNRLSMDMMLSFFASILNGLLVGFSLFLYGPKFYKLLFGSSNDYERAIKYTFISVFIDFILYIFSFIYHKWMNGFFMIELFVKYIFSMTILHRLLFFFLLTSIFAQLQK